jgi:membrane associated rhomboid family serine protease
MSDETPPIEEFDLPMPDDIAVKRCYRHPNRETGVSCSNCGRPICYECMTPAAVGFRCPECMAEQRKTSGRARVITRQQTRGRWQGGMLGSSATPVTRVLLFINVAVFVIEVMMSGGNFFNISGSVLVRLGGLVPAFVAIKHEYWRLVAPMFLHAGLIHILFNMWALVVLGSFFERIVGWKKFLVIYLIAGLAGNVAGFLLSPSLQLMVGASTAIYGIFGAFFMYAYRHRTDFVANQMMRQIGFLIVISLVITFSIPGLSWQGHVGGLLGGIVAYEALTRWGQRDPRAPFDAEAVAATAAMLIVLGALVWWHVQTFVL